MAAATSGRAITLQSIATNTIDTGSSADFTVDGLVTGNTLTKTHDEGGVGLGTFGASGLLFVLLVALVIYQTATHRRQTREIPTEPAENMA